MEMAQDPIQMWTLVFAVLNIQILLPCVSLESYPFYLRIICQNLIANS
jgi:hypothetical protein